MHTIRWVKMKALKQTTPWRQEGAEPGEMKGTGERVGHFEEVSKPQVAKADQWAQHTEAYLKSSLRGKCARQVTAFTDQAGNTLFQQDLGTTGEQQGCSTSHPHSGGPCIAVSTSICLRGLRISTALDCRLGVHAAYTAYCTVLAVLSVCYDTCRSTPRRWGGWCLKLCSKKIECSTWAMA